MGLDKDFGLAFAKSQIAAGNSLPTRGLTFISLQDKHKNEGINLAKKLVELNFTLCGTSGTADIIKKNGIKCKKVNKVSGGSPHIVDILNSKKIALVINTGGGKRTFACSRFNLTLRRATLINKIPYCTTICLRLSACIQAIDSLKE